MPQVIDSKVEFEAVLRAGEWLVHDTGIIDKDVNSTVGGTNALYEGSNGF